MDDKPMVVPQTRRITPIAQLGGRLPVAGKLRLGVKAGRGMKAIDTFRFTSKHQDLIEKAAELYGAKEGPRPWSDPAASPKNQFEVITDTSTLRVFLPRNALSTWYELWSGGGIQRRCDGETCEQVRMVGDGAELSEIPCLCQAEGVLKCKPTSRLNVVLPDLRLAGTWLLESKGWNAMQELAGMEHVITEMQNQVGVIEAQLSIEKVSRMVGGRRRNYVVPKLELAHSAVELMSGQANVQALRPAMATVHELHPSTQPKELEQPVQIRPGRGIVRPETDWFDDDDEIVDAEIIEEQEPEKEVPLLEGAKALAGDVLTLDLVPEGVTTDDLFGVLIRWASRDMHTEWEQLNERQKMAVINALRDVLRKDVTIIWGENGISFKRTGR